MMLQSPVSHDSTTAFRASPWLLPQLYTTCYKVNHQTAAPGVLVPSVSMNTCMPEHDMLWTIPDEHRSQPTQHRSGFYWGRRVFFSITPLQVSLSLPKWALNSHTRMRECQKAALSSTLCKDSKKGKYAELLFVPMTQLTATQNTLHPTPLYPPAGGEPTRRRCHVASSGWACLDPIGKGPVHAIICDHLFLCNILL